MVPTGGMPPALRAVLGKAVACRDPRRTSRRSSFCQRGGVSARWMPQPPSHRWSTASSTVPRRFASSSGMGARWGRMGRTRRSVSGPRGRSDAWRPHRVSWGWPAPTSPGTHGRGPGCALGRLCKLLASHEALRDDSVVPVGHEDDSTSAPVVGVLLAPTVLRNPVPTRSEDLPNTTLPHSFIDATVLRARHAIATSGGRSREYAHRARQDDHSNDLLDGSHSLRMCHGCEVYVSATGSTVEERANLGELMHSTAMEEYRRCHLCL